MKKLSIALCDDDTLFLRVVASTLKSTLQKLNVDSEIYAFPSSSQFLYSVPKRKYDLFLLDIDMPDRDGISLGTCLREMGYHTPIIYLSAMEDQVYDTFRTNPFMFIRKTHFVDEIEGVMSRFVEETDFWELHRFVLRDSGGKAIGLEISKVLYVESQNKNQSFRLLDEDKPIIVRCTMNYLEDELKKRGFLRPHRAYLVNCKYIRLIDHDLIYLTTGHTVPLSRNKAEEFLVQYTNLMV